MYKAPDRIDAVAGIPQNAVAQALADYIRAGS
jgi:hypothetical protein